jgi:conjugative relaxase-like TrwC/TraI family protein
VLTISKPLSARHIRTYYWEEFSDARENYFVAGDQIHGQWHGRLANRWGLSGEVYEKELDHLAEGQHPFTGERLVRHRAPRAYTNRRGRTMTTMAHRAGWDATFKAPKSVSLTALVGGDACVAAAHRESVLVAIDELEQYVQANLGNHPNETTGQWVAATFQHDSARPVDGYAAPHLHTHVVFFNVTERNNGDTRALDPRELYKTQPFGTALYRAELATRLIALGYEIEPGRSGQPEIRGYTTEYLIASSPRSQQIQGFLTRVGQWGAGAREFAFHCTRGAKLEVSHEEMRRRHLELAEACGQQPARVVQAARDRAARLEQIAEFREPRTTAHAAVTFAKARNFEREALVDERVLLRDALSWAMGEVTSTAIAAEFERRVAAGEFISRAQPPWAPGRAFTTPEMIDPEAPSIQMRRGGHQTEPALEEVRREVQHASSPARTLEPALALTAF